jgi:hypothetical protein
MKKNWLLLMIVKPFGRLLIILALMLSLALPVFSQLKETGRKEVNAEKFYIDRLENYYFQKNNAITRTDKNFREIASYDYKGFGNISFVDVSNPFKTLIFYKDLNRLVYLDNYMAELRAPILLDDLQLYNVDAACNSSQGGFWVYDSQNTQAVLVNSDLTKVQQGVNLYSLVESSSAKSILESNNFLFLLFESGQVIILDKFGSFYKNINYLNVRYFDVFNDIAYFVNDSELTIYNIQTGEVGSYALPDIKIDGFRVFTGNLVFLSGENLVYYRFE